MLTPWTRQLCQCSAETPAGPAAPRAAPGLAAGELLPPVLPAVAVQPATASSAAHAVIRASRRSEVSTNSSCPIHRTTRAGSLTGLTRRLLAFLPLALFQGPPVLLDDDVVQFGDRGVVGHLVEGDLAVLQQVDP